MNLLELNIDTITPYWRNPRKIEGAVEAVRKSIEQYGFNVPIVVDANHVIINGHTRYRALRELGITNVMVVVVDMEEREARRYRIADNKTSEFARWDMDKLKEELGHIAPDEVAAFFSADEWKVLVGSPPEEPQAPPPTPDAPPATGDGEKMIECLCPYCLENNRIPLSSFA